MRIGELYFAPAPACCLLRMPKISGGRTYRPIMARLLGRSERDGFSTMSRIWWSLSLIGSGRMMPYCVTLSLGHGLHRYDGIAVFVVDVEKLGDARVLRDDEIIGQKNGKGLVIDEAPRAENGMTQAHAG